ncbi:transposable element Tcb2 transposase [Trichonephila clavipes]|nr:transposable element Tcb2 transposase [Trichonephila clavipes]
MVPVVQSVVNGTCNDHFTILVLGAIDLLEYQRSSLAIGLHVFASAREHKAWSVDDWKRVARTDESRFRLLNANGKLIIWRQFDEAMNPACQVGTIQMHDGSIRQYNCTSLKSRLTSGWWDEHSSDLSIINWPPRNPDVYHIQYTWDVLKQNVKCHHTAPMNCTEVWTAVTNIREIIPVEHFRKLFESILRRVAAAIKVREAPTLY